MKGGRMDGWMKRREKRKGGKEAWKGGKEKGRKRGQGRKEEGRKRRRVSYERKEGK